MRCNVLFRSLTLGYGLHARVGVAAAAAVLCVQACRGLMLDGRRVCAARQGEAGRRQVPHSTSIRVRTATPAFFFLVSLLLALSCTQRAAHALPKLLQRAGCWSLAEPTPPPTQVDARQSNHPGIAPGHRCRVHCCLVRHRRAVSLCPLHLPAAAAGGGGGGTAGRTSGTV